MGDLSAVTLPPTDSLSPRNPLDVSNLTSTSPSYHPLKAKDSMNSSRQDIAQSRSPSFSCPSLDVTLKSHGATAPIETPRFRLQMRQEPRHGLAVGNDESAFKNARMTPLDPPPICELVPEKSSDVRFISVPELSVQACLVQSESPYEVVASSSKTRDPMISGLQECGFIAPVTGRHEECLFVFAELGVRVAGDYRIRFDLIDRLGFQFRRLTSIYSQPFSVVADKRSFAGLTPSTDLVQSLVRRGLKLRIIKPQSGKTRKRKKSEKDGPERSFSYSGQEGGVDSGRSNVVATTLTPNSPADYQSSSNWPTQHSHRQHSHPFVYSHPHQPSYSHPHQPSYSHPHQPSYSHPTSHTYPPTLSTSSPYQASRQSTYYDDSDQRGTTSSSSSSSLPGWPVKRLPLPLSLDSSQQRPELSLYLPRPSLSPSTGSKTSIESSGASIPATPDDDHFRRLPGSFIKPLYNPITPRSYPYYKDGREDDRTVTSRPLQKFPAGFHREVNAPSFQRDSSLSLSDPLSHRRPTLPPLSSFNSSASKNNNNPNTNTNLSPPRFPSRHW